MKINERKLVTSLLLLFAIFLAVTWLSSPSIRFTLFPPKDLFDPLAKGYIDVSKVDAEYSFQFVNKYSGWHTIGIAVRKFPDQYYRLNRVGFKAEITVSQDGRLLLKRETARVTAYLWGWNKSGGFDLLFYKVPDDLPQSTPLLCTIRITKANRNFERVYGKPEFFIGKISDE